MEENITVLAFEFDNPETINFISSHLLLLRSSLGLGTFLGGPLCQTPGDELVPLHQPHEPAFREPPGNER